MEKLSVLQGKTPISYLQELCTKRNVTPQYDLIANEGAVHEPTFVFRVIAGEFFGTGKGPSKKKAKHSAALSILSQMLGLNQSCFESDDGNGSSKDIDELAGNPVGDLQEFSQRKLLPPPEYVFTGEQGPPHAREFICMVQLANFQERGTGKSKKLAKRNAALAMLQLMKQGVGAVPKVEVEPIVEADAVDDGLPLPQTESTTSRTDFAKFLSQQPVLLEEVYKRVTRYFDNARKSRQPLPSPVPMINVESSSRGGREEVDYCAMLQQLGVEQKFDILFIDLFQLSLSDGVQCLIQLSLKPLAVCHGKGLTSNDARCNAAENALSYLEVLHLRGKRC